MARNEYQVISLCQVLDPSSDGPYLARLVDIEGERFVRPDISEYDPHMYRNRDRLYRNDGPNMKGAMGVWGWSTSTNKNDPARDYVESHYYPDIQPIQIIYVQDIGSLEQLVDKIKDGIPAESLFNRFIVAFQANLETIGIVCTKNDITVSNGKMRLNNTVHSLPYIKLHSDMMLKVGILPKTSIDIYQSLSLPKHSERILTQKRSSVIKGIILSHGTTWGAYRSFVGGTNRELNKYKEFLRAITTDSIYQEISEACYCTLEEARRYANEFIQAADGYIDETEIDSSILAELVAHHPGLHQECEKIAQEQWRREHDEEVKKAQQKLASINKDVKTAQAKYDDLSQKNEELQKEFETLQKKVFEQKKIGEDALKTTQDKLKTARENAADFLSDISIYMTALGGAQRGPALTQGRYYNGESCKICDTLNKWKDQVDSLQDMAEDMGVNPDKSQQLAAFLYSAYLHHRHLLIAGPGGEFLANALSAVETGQTADVLECDGEWNGALATEAFCGAGVLIVRNPFHGKWIHRMLPYLAQTQRLVIFVHPIEEDLAIEPRGLYQYVFPLFTSSLMQKCVQVPYIGCTQGDDFVPYSSTKVLSVSVAAMDELRVDPLVKETIKEVLADAISIAQLSSNEEKNEFVLHFVLFPYAAVTGEGEAFCREVGKLGNTKLKKYFLRYFHQENEG